MLPAPKGRLGAEPENIVPDIYGKNERGRRSNLHAWFLIGGGAMLIVTVSLCFLQNNEKHSMQVLKINNSMWHEFWKILSCCFRVVRCCLGTSELTFLAVEKKHAGDNASMIAFAAHCDRTGLWFNKNGELNFKPGLSIDEATNS